MSAHTHRFGGQRVTHEHGPTEVRSDLTMAEHGYFGHVEDRPGEPIGAREQQDS